MNPILSGLWRSDRIFCLEKFKSAFFLTAPFGKLGGSVVKNLPAKAGNCVQSIDQEDPMEQWLTTHSRASRLAQMVKYPPAMQEAWIWSLDWEDSQQEGMATHSSLLAWRIPMDRGACSPWGLKESDTTEHALHFSFSLQNIGPLSFLPDIKFFLKYRFVLLHCPFYLDNHIIDIMLWVIFFY